MEVNPTEQLLKALIEANDVEAKKKNSTTILIASAIGILMTIINMGGEYFRPVTMEQVRVTVEKAVEDSVDRSVSDAMQRSIEPKLKSLEERVEKNERKLNPSTL